jgi:hypothetical protein
VFEPGPPEALDEPVPAPPPRRADRAPRARATSSRRAAGDAGARDRPAPRPDPVPGCLHNYPLAARQPGLSAAFGLALRTAPFALFRFLQWSALAAISVVILTVAIAGGTWLTVSVNRYAGAIVMLGAIIAWAFLWLPIANRISFGTLCRHILILTHLITTGRSDENGEGMFAFSRRVVTSRMGDLATVGRLYRTINSALFRLSRVLGFADCVLAIDLSALRRFIDRVVVWVSPYLTAVVLSYGMARGDRDFSQAGRDGICYSAQNGRALMKTVIGAFLLESLLVAPLWLAAFAGFGYAAFRFTYVQAGGDWPALIQHGGLAVAAKAHQLALLGAIAAGVVAGLLLGLLIVKIVREALVRPALLAMVMIKFHLAVENQPLDEGWRERLNDADAMLKGLDDFRWRARRLANRG